MQLARERPAFTPSPSFEGSSVATEATDDRPSFASIEGSPYSISAAEEPERPEVEDDEFEFSFMVGDPELDSDFNVADEIFSNGQIRPVYPVFNRDLLLAAGAGDAEGEKDDEKAIRLPLRRLLIEDREACSRSGSVSSTSSSADDLEGIAPGTYCVWNPRSVPPSPDRCKKSSSTGSTSRKWRIRDLVVGRSHSDGKEKFLFLAPPEKEKRPSPGASPCRSAAKGKGATVLKDGNEKGGEVTEVDMVTAHQLYYVKGGNGGARRSFLPYKIGFFTNVNGLSRTHRPF